MIKYWSVQVLERQTNGQTNGRTDRHRQLSWRFRPCNLKTVGQKRFSVGACLFCDRKSRESRGLLKKTSLMWGAQARTEPGHTLQRLQTKYKGWNNYRQVVRAETDTDRLEKSGMTTNRLKGVRRGKQSQWLWLWQSQDKHGTCGGLGTPP